MIKTMKLFTRLILTTACALLCSLALDAQPIRVKANATGANDGTSWANAYTSLSVALAAAPAGAEIWVAAGTYKPVPNAVLALSSFTIDKAVNLYGGFAGTENALNERNFTTNATILSGDQAGNDISGDFTTNRTDNVYHVISITVTGGGIPLLDGIQIKGGNTPLVTTGITLDNRGGGILALTTSHLRNCTFSDNSATAGGALGVVSTDASNTVIENCTFEKNNTNLQGSGLQMEQLQGAIIKQCKFKNSTGARGALHMRNCSAVTIDDCRFEGNTDISFGAGLYNWNSSFTALNSTFVNNTAVSGGGGAYNDQRQGGTFTSFQNCTFEQNTCTGSGTRGGALYHAGAITQLDNCLFKNNMSAGSGGAVNNATATAYNYNACNFEGNIGNFGGACTNYDNTSGTYNNCKFSGNTANAGGGCLSYGFSAQGTVNFCEFSNNTATTIGGGVYVQNDNTSVSINNSFFSSNNAISSGGAMYTRAGSNVNINESEFIGNTAPTGAAINTRQDTTSRPVINVNRSTFTLNFAETQGGAFNISNANVVLTNCLVGGNGVNNGPGGGFSNNASGGFPSTLRLVNCTVANNSATIGPGISNWQDSIANSNASLSTFNTVYENNGNNYEIEDGAPLVISEGGNHSSDLSFMGTLNGINDAQNTSPQFVDAGLDDYHLKATSPCVNTGVATGAPQYDLEGGLRDAAPDKGAYELGSVGTNSPYQDFEITLAPNPTVGPLTIQLPNEIKGAGQISLFDQSGKLVKTMQVNAQGQIIDFPMIDMPAGAYRIAIEVGKLKSTSHIVKL